MKKILTILLLATLTLGAGAQVPDGCELPTLPELSAKERRDMKETLDAWLKDWQKIGASGFNPALKYNDINDKRISIDLTYIVADSTKAFLDSNSEYLRAASLFDATNRLRDLFEMVANLGYDVMASVVLRTITGRSTSVHITNFDNATLRYIMSLKSSFSVYVYSDVVEVLKKIPFGFEDSVICTGISYCNHLWTMTLHSSIAFDPEDDSYIVWAVHTSEIVSDADFMRFVGMDSTTARFIIVQDGAKDTFTFDYTPAQLLGEEPALDINWLGNYLAQGIDRTFPMPMQSSTGTMEHCSYDPTLQVLVIECLMDEIDVVGNVGREEQVKLPILEAMLAASEGNDFIQALAEVGLGLEYRIQSRTTRRPLTITFTPDELRVFILERQ